MTDPEAVFSHTEICLYLDFYGQLLTSHCHDVLDMHYEEDMSLAEIAESLGISRQAVHDRIRQGVHQLHDYEQNLGLIARFKANRESLISAIRALDDNKPERAREILRELAEAI